MKPATTIFWVEKRDGVWRIRIGRDLIHRDNFPIGHSGRRDAIKDARIIAALYKPSILRVRSAKTGKIIYEASYGIKKTGRDSD